MASLSDCSSRSTNSATNALPLRAEMAPVHEHREEVVALVLPNAAERRAG
jgi:hypothetical protein